MVNILTQRQDCKPTSKRLQNRCSLQLQIFRRFYVPTESMFSSLLQPLNPNLNSVCIKISVVAWNNVTLPKALCVAIMDLLFSNYACTTNPQFSPIQTKMGSKSDHNKTTFIHLPLTQLDYYPFLNCLVSSAAPCTFSHSFLDTTPKNNVMSASDI